MQESHQACFLIAPSACVSARAAPLFDSLFRAHRGHSQAIAANKLIHMGAAGADALARMLHLLNTQAAILPFARGRFSK